MNLLHLADRLHKTVDEIEEISVTEYYEWMAYFAILKKEADKNG